MKDSGCREPLRFHFSYISLFLTNGTPAAFDVQRGFCICAHRANIEKRSFY